MLIVCISEIQLLAFAFRRYQIERGIETRVVHAHGGSVAPGGRPRCSFSSE